jgi:hypothetical protein
MTDRAAELRRLVARLSEHEDVEDAYLAKSFTDRLLVVDLRADAPVPPELVDRLAEHDLYGANEVYDREGADRSFMGEVGGANRHHFVDVRTRGDHQSYVVE